MIYVLGWKNLGNSSQHSILMRGGHAWRDEGEGKGLSFLFLTERGNSLFLDVKKLIIFIRPKLFIAQ